MKNIKIMPADVHPYNFKIYLKDSEVEFLKKHDFSRDVPMSKLSEEESLIVKKMDAKGILRSHSTYTQGTVLYTQLISQLN
jgi:hypothetical protein|tara:strand:+ start:5545 stop:5787 length:243 start_codon:yes stop_codon:yes gene_type:complete